MFKPINFIDTKAVFPALISLGMVTVSQAVRLYFDYSIYPILLYVPLLVYLFLVLVNIIADNQRTAGLNSYAITGISKIYWFVLCLFFCTVIGLRFTFIVWGSSYLSPVYEAQYIAGRAHIDTLFQAAVSNMLMIFNTPSIGVEGLVVLKYHFGSHWLIGFVGKIFNLGAFEAYHLLYPVLILPIWLGLFLTLTESIRCGLKLKINRLVTELSALVLFFFTVGGILPEPVRAAIRSTNSTIISESHATAIALLYLFMILLIRVSRLDYIRVKYILFIALTVLGSIGLTLTKGSVGTLWVSGYVFFWISNPKQLRRLWLALIAGVGWLITVPFVSGGAVFNEGIEIFNFLREYVDLVYWAWFPLVHFGLTIFAILLVKYAESLKWLDQDKSSSLQFVLAGVAIISILPGSIFKIYSGALYFTTVNWWVSLPLVSVFVAKIAISKSREWLNSEYIARSLKYMAVVLLFVFFVTAGLNTHDSYTKFIVNNKSYIASPDEKSAQLWDLLSTLQQDESNPYMILYDTVPPYGFRGVRHHRTWMSALMSSSALAGIPTINEVEPYLGGTAISPVGYGFDTLTRKEYIDTSEEYNILRIKDLQKNLANSTNK